MLQRGRKSSASLALPMVDGGPARLAPPPSLSDPERATFISLVESVDRRHFRPSDVPLLCAYCRAIVLEVRAARELAQSPLDNKWLSLWEKSSRAMVALAGKLRLCPQSRLDPKSAHRERVPGPRPWGTVE